MKKKVFDLTAMMQIAMLICIQFVMKAIGLGSVPVGPLYMSFLTLPIAVGAMIIGPEAGAILGGVFGLVENEYNGKVTKRCELRWFCADDKADSAAIPQAKLLPNSNTVVNAPTASTGQIDGFLSIPDGMDEEIPF